MIKTTYLILIAVFGLTSVKAQTGVEKVLSEIERNNKSIISQKQYREAEKISYKTGLNPENPKVDYEHLPGRPEGAGTQKDFSVTQDFDFPTSYAKKRSVSNQQIAQSELQFMAFRQQILLDSKLACIDYVYHKRLQTELDKRLQNASMLLDAITRKTEQGESNVLDLNKVKLVQLEIKNQAALNATELKTLQHKLDELNGGVPLELSQLDYPVILSLPPFETLDSLIESNDPEVKTVKQEREINKAQLGLTRSLTLPKLEGGYHQQSILGQKYQGFHVGMTIPVWENKNRVKTEQARLMLAEFQITEHRTKHYFENKQLYEQYLHWLNTFNEYNTILTSANNEELLNKALEHGELSLVEYVMEARYFYDAAYNYIVAERELQSVVARLYKFQL
jgi:outer membrane protein, heavy metal efflux system